MTKQDIISHLLKNPKLAEKYSEKYLKALVEEQLFLRDYKKIFSKCQGAERNCTTWFWWKIKSSWRIIFFGGTTGKREKADRTGSEGIYGRCPVCGKWSVCC